MVSLEGSGQIYFQHKKMQETWVQLLVCEDPLEKEMATHSSILAWRILWTEEPGRLQLWGHRVRHDLGTETQHQT